MENSEGDFWCSKPGKPLEYSNSCRSISLLPTISKLLEKQLIERMREINDKLNIVPWIFQKTPLSNKLIE